MSNENNIPQNDGQDQTFPDNGQSIPQADPMNGSIQNDQTTQNQGMNGNQNNGNGNNDFSSLEEELQTTKLKLSELTLISQQALADLQNYKKRTEDEKAQLIFFANASLITDLLLILDNSERALEHIPTDPSAQEWANGVMAILKQVKDILTTRGLSEIPANIGTPFNPEVHEAVMTSAGAQDTIVNQLEKGYKLGERVIRRSKVIVGNGQTSNATPVENQATEPTTQQPPISDPQSAPLPEAPTTQPIKEEPATNPQATPQDNPTTPGIDLNNLNSN